jgi:tRNA(Ile)-lysidine synthase TilS/MesJ
MNIEKKVIETIKKYKLLNKREKIAVALSGGKDSTTVLYLLHKLGYNVFALMIDLELGEWSRKNKQNMQEFCDENNIALYIVNLREELGKGISIIKSILKQQENLTACYVCGVIKKYILNKYAKKLKADKIATGHNLDDECQTVLMNFLKGNIYLGINSGPATGQGKSFSFTQRVKPLFFIPESEVKKYSKIKKFPVVYEKCPCAFESYRIKTRKWLENLSNKKKSRIVKNFQKLI